MNGEKYSHIIKIRVIDKIIILVTFICLISTLGFSIFSFYKASENQIQLTESTLQEYAKEYETYIREYIQYHFSILEYMASVDDIYNMNWEHQLKVLNGDRALFDFEHFIIMDMNGNGYYTNTNEIKNQSKESFFKDVINNETYLTDPFWEEAKNRSIITLSVSIYKDNEKVGALCGVLDLQNINHIFQYNKVGNNGEDFLIDKKGYYIAHPDMTYVHNRENIFEVFKEEESDIDLLKDAMKHKKLAVGEIKLNNKLYLFSINPIDWDDLYVVSLLDKDETLIKLQPIIKSQVMLVVFSIVLILLGIRMVSRIIVTHRLAYTDVLTKINNRAAYDRVYEQFNNNYEVSISVITFDLDGFKDINDTYGHKAGDEVLYNFANILKIVFGNIGFVARLGGDEFIVMIADVSSLDLEIKLDEMQVLIDEYNSLNIKLDTSYGIAIREKGDRSNLSEFFEQADINMYRYKNNKRGCRTKQ